MFDLKLNVGWVKVAYLSKHCDCALCLMYAQDDLV